LEPGSEQARRYLKHCDEARALYLRRTRTGGRGRPRLAIPWPILIELAAVIFADSNRPITSHPDGAFAQFIGALYGVTTPLHEIKDFLRRFHAR
jgi:hypothetical protein